MIYMVLISVVSIFSLGFLWISSVLSQFEKEEIRQRTTYIENQKAVIKSEVDQALGFVKHMQSKTKQRLRDSIKDRVNEAYAIAENIYQQQVEEKTIDEIKSNVINALRPIRYNHGRGYYFAFDLNGIERLFPSKPNSKA